MELKEVDIDSIKEYPNNPRLGDIEKITESLETHGQYRPLTVNQNTMEILTGNHTWLAMKELGWEKALVTFIDVDEEKAKKIVLVDNRLSDIADYDTDILTNMLQDMVEDLVGTGYVLDDLDELLNNVDDEVEIQIEDIEVHMETEKPQAIKDVVLYLDDEQFANYKKWIEAIAEHYKCNLTEACYQAVMMTYKDLFND